jgi:predicted transcriptional regulator
MSEVMHFMRNLREPWLKNGWIKKDGKKYCLTDTGKGSLEMVG